MSNFFGKFVLIVFAGHETYHMHLQNVNKKSPEMEQPVKICIFEDKIILLKKLI